MENAVIILDSSDDETECKKRPKTEENKSTKRSYSSLTKPIIANRKSDKSDGTGKRKNSADGQTSSVGHKIRRIKPTKLSDEISIKFKPNDDDTSFENDVKSIDPPIDKCTAITAADETDCQANKESQEEKTAINTAFATLLDACRNADPSSDMELLIKKKLIRYYEMVHPDFVNSKSFSKTALAVADDINANPTLVYLKLSGILEELNIRRKSGQTVISNEQITSTGNARRDYQIKRLNHALYILKKKIAKLDEAEVDLNDDDNSTYLLVERYKKRACEIYEKICDITGESKHAHRQVRKPITFQGTNYPEFNRTIQAFVNRTKTFPDMFDVLRCLEHCNNQYGFRLNKDQIKSIAQDAFIKIGKSLQKRRKTDLYETVSYFTGTESDPALEDSSLQSKLAENQKYHLRINEIIDKYAAVQDKAASESKCNNNVDDSKSDDNNDKDKENQINNGIIEAPPITVALESSDDSDDEDENDSRDDGNDDDIATKTVSCSKQTSELPSICSLNDNGIVISDDEELALP